MSTKRIKQIVFAFALLCLCALASADTYSYDKLGRLTSNNYANGDSITYSYDAAGNLVKVVAVNVSHPLPVCTLVANPASVPAGGSSTLTATCDGAPNSYVWTGGTCADTTAATCTVSLSATMTYTVAGVNAGGSGAPASATITVTAAPVFLLTVSTTGAGTVTSNPAGINCGATCNANFDSGSAVTLTAVATAGNTFSGWGGDCNGQASCVVSMSAARNVSANFTVSNTGGSLNVPLVLTPGWNLLGNSLNQALSVVPTFSDVAVVSTVWKWDIVKAGWQFYTPQLNASELQTYATSQGYGVLSVINPGEGYWVNAKVAASLGTQTGTAFALTSANLVTGWNLVATGSDVSPTAFNTSLSATPPSPGTIPLNLTTLWAWDSALSNWYFYAPSLEATSGLAAHIAGKGYLDFTQHSKTLGKGLGFWVNKP
jgi:YD repeat-containing protein